MAGDAPSKEPFLDFCTDIYFDILIFIRTLKNDILKIKQSVDKFFDYLKIILNIFF